MITDEAIFSHSILKGGEKKLRIDIATIIFTVGEKTFVSPTSLLEEEEKRSVYN